MEATIFILTYLTSEVVFEAFKALALLFCGGYPIAQALIRYSANEDRKAALRVLQEEQARDVVNAQLLGIQKSDTVVSKDKGADSGGGPVAYLTDEQRKLGKKLIEEVRKAGQS